MTNPTRQQEKPKDRFMHQFLSVAELGRQVQNRWIWQGVSFELHPGERLAVIGASGTGKSLLLRALAGLDSVQKGQIIFKEKSFIALIPVC